MPTMLTCHGPSAGKLVVVLNLRLVGRAHNQSGLSLCVTGDSEVTRVSEIRLSLLDTLWSTRPLDLARRQKIHTNPREEAIPGWHQCWEYLALKRNGVVSHVKCAKHQKSKEKLLEKEARERDLARDIEQQDDCADSPLGWNSHKVYRIWYGIDASWKILSKVGVPRPQESFAIEWLLTYGLNVRLSAFFLQEEHA